MTGSAPTRRRIRVQLTIDPDIHAPLMRLLEPLNRYKRKERLLLLIYQGLHLEAIATGTVPADGLPRLAARPADEDSAHRWVPQVDGDASEILGLLP